MNEIIKNMVKEKYRGLIIKAVPTSQNSTEFNTIIVRYDHGNNVYLVATGGIRDTEKECIFEGKQIIDNLKRRKP